MNAPLPLKIWLLQIAGGYGVKGYEVVYDIVIKKLVEVETMGLVIGWKKFIRSEEEDDNDDDDDDGGGEK